MNDHSESQNLPIIIDEFDAGGQTNSIIRGSILRCNDGFWADREGLSFATGTEMLALGTTKAAQHWQGGKPIETIIGTLPDIEALNEAIPKDQWEQGLSGLRPPWIVVFVVYLIDPRDGSIYTFINSTVGARIAVERLTQRTQAMRMLRGQRVSPVVKLDAKPMVTKYGQKMRPEFTITDWRDLSGDEVEHKSTPQIGKPVKPTTTAEEIADELPF
jgi:hypothetical protein